MVAMQCVLFSFIPFPVVTQPGAGGSQPGEKENSAPYVVAVFLEEGAFGAIDEGRRSRMRRQGGVLVGVGFLDFCGAGQFPAELRSNGKWLPDECADCRLG